MPAKGLIIQFDGSDGVGKTTQLQLAARALKTVGRTVYETRAVGGTPLGELLRAALLSDTQRPPETDLHIVLASQYALATEIKARRDRGEIVLMDRSPLSIAAYQVFGDGLDKTQGYKAIDELQKLIKPDLTIIYAANANTVAERRNNRNASKTTDYFESKPREYHERVVEGFADAATVFGAKIIDASPSIEAIHQSTMKLLATALET